MSHRMDCIKLFLIADPHLENAHM